MCGLITAICKNGAVDLTVRDVSTADLLTVGTELLKTAINDLPKQLVPEVMAEVTKEILFTK